MLLHILELAGELLNNTDGLLSINVRLTIFCGFVPLHLQLLLQLDNLMGQRLYFLLINIGHIVAC